MLSAILLCQQPAFRRKWSFVAASTYSVVWLRHSGALDAAAPAWRSIQLAECKRWALCAQDLGTQCAQSMRDLGASASAECVGCICRFKIFAKGVSGC